jgi:hypothetical protein
MKNHGRLKPLQGSRQALLFHEAAILHRIRQVEAGTGGDAATIRLT